ncbi:acyltransferase family protein [Nostoc sp.]|uniref:acyltransferase family protein n=1 Tax=Nostoc sp. TaxID=1180 RepID=UPI002FF7921E
MKETSAYPKSCYRPDIDGLRALALVAVIINHFNKDLLPGGYLGVDIFFVISGFVITSSLAGRPSKNFGDFLLGFYSRRIKRLAPALVLFVVSNSVLICMFNPSPSVSLETGIKSLFGLSNLYLLQHSTDYFAASTELNVFTHTWSLGVEEQFYFLFPFLVWFTGFSRLTTKGVRNLFWVTAALSIASLIAFAHLYQTNQPAAYFLMPTRFWELGTGCLLFLGLKYANRFLHGLQSIPPLVVTAAVIVVFFIPLKFAVQATIAIVVLTAVLITCLRAGTAGYELFTHQRVVYIGLISYSLYLWHWGVLSLSRWTIGIHWWSVPFQIALMLLLAVASYRYVETPLRRADKSRWQSIGYGMGASALAAAVLTGISGGLYENLFSDKQNFLSRDYNVIFSERVLWNQADCLTSRESTKKIEREIFDKCNITKEVGSEKLKNQLFWYGDSYAEQLSPVVSLISKERFLPANLFVASGCPSSQVASYSLETEKGYCAKVFKQYISYFLENSKAGDLLVLSNAFHYWNPGESLIDPSGGYKFQDGTTSFNHYLREISELSDKLRSKGRKLSLVSDIPVISRNPNVCVYWFAKLNNNCNSEFISSNNAYRRSISKTITNHSRFKDRAAFLDIYTPIYSLLASDPNKYIEYYRDEEHLTRKGAIYLKKDILAFLRENQLLK